MFRSSMLIAVAQPFRCGLMTLALILLHDTFTRTNKSTATNWGSCSPILIQVRGSSTGV